MPIRLGKVLALVTLVALVALTPAARGPARAGAGAGSPSSSLQERLAKGEVVVIHKAVAGFQIPRTRLLGVIEASPEAVWKLLTTCEAHMRAWPNMKEAVTVRAPDGRKLCRTTIGLPLGLGSMTVTVEPRATADRAKQKFVYAYEQVEGDYRTYGGAWTLVPFDGTGTRTLAVNELHAVPKMPIPLPTAAIRAQQTERLTEAFQQLRTCFK